VKLKIALVGCGKAAEQHITEIRKLPNASLIAVCDQEPLMAEQLATRFGIVKSYVNFQELLVLEKPDVVHIATPPQSHLELATLAVDSGCHVLLEKPLGMNYDETSRILSYVETHGRKLTVGYTYYFDPSARILRRLLAEGVIGDPVHIESFLGYNLNGPFGSVVLADPNHWVHDLPGKLIHNVVDHLLNKVTEFIDATPIVKAYSWQGTRPGEADTKALPDELRAMLIGEGVSAYVTFSSRTRPIRHLLNVYGTKNAAHIDFENSTITLDPGSALPGVLGRLAWPFAESWQHFREGGRNVLRFTRSQYHMFAGLNQLLSSFYDSILNDSPVPIPYCEILRVSRLTDEIIQQLNGVEVSDKQCVFS
jgi:predicted dehydrogenase